MPGCIYAHKTRQPVYQSIAMHPPLQVSLYFSESPTNPYMRCVDIARIAAMCHARGALVAVDSTFATPINSRPLALGADLVIHSATKYLAGHNDVLAGAIAGEAGGRGEQGGQAGWEARQ
jgi:cystathionine beta-lyase/cystathionine gamma-synthase